MFKTYKYKNDDQQQNCPIIYILLCDVENSSDNTELFKKMELLFLHFSSRISIEIWNFIQNLYFHHIIYCQFVELVLEKKEHFQTH